jgi:hypothetical protein
MKIQSRPVSGQQLVCAVSAPLGINTWEFREKIKAPSKLGVFGSALPRGNTPLF